MVQIKISHMTQGLVADLEITDRLSIVTGNSGTGKTHLCNMVQTSLDEDNGVLSIAAYDTVIKKNAEIYFAQSAEILQGLLENPKTDRGVIICDEYTANKYIQPTISKYVLLFDREYYTINSENEVSLMNLRYINGIYHLKPSIKQYDWKTEVD